MGLDQKITSYQDKRHLIAANLGSDLQSSAPDGVLSGVNVARFLKIAEILFTGF